MSKYTKGDRFVIEIDKVVEDKDLGDRYFVKKYDTLVFDDKGLDRLEEYDTTRIEDSAYHRGYLRGMDDAWETAKKIALGPAEGGLKTNEMKTIFSTSFISRIFNNFNVFEAVQRVTRYEELRGQFNVGEEVVDNAGFKYFIIAVDEHTCRLVNSNGYDVTLEKDEFVKTGKRYNISSILKEMKESESCVENG